jgi:excisionase family DNA binding protein
VLSEHDRYQLHIDAGALDYYIPEHVTVPLLSMKEVAQWLGLNKRTVARKVQRGEIVGSKLGHLWKFERTDVQAYIDAMKKNAVVHITK